LTGLLTRINKGTRRHAQELIGNLRLIQGAYCYVDSFVGMNTDFTNYLSSLLIHYQSSSGFHDSRVRHETKSDDRLVRLPFPLMDIKYYKTLHMGKIRLSTRSYAEGKVADDSNIFFLLDGVEYPGRIRSIFTINNCTPLLLVGYLSNLTPTTCEIYENESFACPNLLFTTATGRNYVPVTMDQFIEKSAFF
jgi:hypothetical protein